MNIVKEQVDEAVKAASTHSLKCSNLIDTEGLAKAMEYAASMGIKPPQCSLTAISSNADAQRAKAARMLSETKWWTRRLKNKALQDFEHKQREQGNVQEYISDELMNFYKANR